MCIIFYIIKPISSFTLIQRAQYYRLCLILLSVIFINIPTFIRMCHYTVRKLAKKNVKGQTLKSFTSEVSKVSRVVRSINYRTVPISPPFNKGRLLIALKVLATIVNCWLILITSIYSWLFI